MKYFYIHGYNATGKTTAGKLSSLLDCSVEVLHWEYLKSFDENFNNLLNILEKEQDDFILMGSSMGGYYANALANQLLVPCALFNPVINPKEILPTLKGAEFTIPQKIIDSYKEIKNIVIPRLIVVGIKDNILNPNKTIEYWTGKCEIKVVDEGHQITNFENLKKSILSLNAIALY